MADVKKCDICGAIFNENRRAQYREIKHIHGGYVEPTHYDACNACAERIKEFMDVLRKHGENYILTAIIGPHDEETVHEGPHDRKNGEQENSNDWLDGDLL